MELALGGPLENWFTEFDIKPLASASIAQVHTARLKDTNQEVVLKVIRPDIRPVIDSDLKLMHRMARIVAGAMPEARRLKPVEVVREYEKPYLMNSICVVKRRTRFNCVATSKAVKSFTYQKFFLTLVMKLSWFLSEYMASSL